MNRCAGDGTVAPSENPIPTDPTVFNWRGNPSVTPCSAIACSACKATVRWVDGGWYDGTNAQLEALYELANPLDGPDVHGPREGIRLYFCRCKSFNCSTSMGLFLRWEVAQLGLPEPWSCGGHPTLALPLEVGGETIPADVHWGHLLTATFQKPVDPEDAHRWPQWVQQVYGRLAGTPHQAGIEAAIAELLISDNDVLCSRAIRFLWVAPDTPAADLLLGLVDGLGDTLIGRKDPFGEGDLYGTALHAIVRHIDRGRWPYADPIVTRVRDLVARPGDLTAFLWFLASHDLKWLRANKEALLDASPDAVSEWKELLR